VKGVRAVARKTGSFLPDRFDDIRADVSYVGAHRRQRSALSIFAPIGIALAAVVVLVLAGLWFVDRNNANFVGTQPAVTAVEEPTGAEEPAVEEDFEEAIEPVLDPSTIDTEGLTIRVVNGIGTPGLAARAGGRLLEAGWPEPTPTNADSTGVPQSAVAYEDDEDFAIALGIALVLGIDLEEVIQSSQYPGARITVVLGADYIDTEAT
jgi:hypothetical protein